MRLSCLLPLWFLVGCIDDVVAQPDDDATVGSADSGAADVSGGGDEPDSGPPVPFDVAQGEDLPPPEDAASGPGDAAVDPVDTTPTPLEPLKEAVPAPGDGPNPTNASLFAPGFTKLALDFEPADWAALEENLASGSKDYVPATFTYDGESLPSAVRLKSNPEDWEGAKPQFVVKFNEYDKAARFRGLRRLVLEANPSDATHCRNTVALGFMRDTGVMTPRSTHAKLTIDGAPFGVYELIEAVDNEFLEDRFAEDGGNLYENGEELKTNESVGDTSDLDALYEALQAGNAAAVDDLVVVGSFLDLAAAEAALGLGDNFWAGGWNFYLYHEPVAGWVILPWDLDDFLIDETPTDADVLTAEGIVVPGNEPHPMMELIRSVPNWRAHFLARVAQRLPALEALDDAVTACCQEVRSAVLADPNAGVDAETFDDACATLKARAAARAQSVAASL